MRQPDRAAPRAAPYRAPDGSPSTKPAIPWWRSSAQWANVLQLVASLVIAGMVAKGWLTQEQADSVDIGGLLAGNEGAIAAAIGLAANGYMGWRGRRNGGAQPSPVKPLIGGR